MEVFVLVFALWFVLALICGWAADQKGYSFALGFAACFVASPFIVALVIAFAPPRERPAAAGRRPSLEDKAIRAIADAPRSRQARGDGGGLHAP